MHISMTHNFKHLLTSGCSFTAWTEPCWAHWLGIELDIPLQNFGKPSAGNSWIAKTAIYGTQRLLDDGADPDDILVAVMWSGIDRKDVFISNETPGYTELLNSQEAQEANPVRFIDKKNDDSGWHISTSDGYLLGSMGCGFANEHINTFKRTLIRDYYCDEALAIESYENFLRLQWYCKSKKIRLVNMTYMDLLHYPKYKYFKITKELTYEHFENIKHLYDMIDFDDWIFWDKTRGLFEYVRDNKLPFLLDGFHPSSVASEHFVKNYLIPKLWQNYL